MSLVARDQGRPRSDASTELGSCSLLVTFGATFAPVLSFLAFNPSSFSPS